MTESSLYLGNLRVRDSNGYTHHMLLRKNQDILLCAN